MPAERNEMHDMDAFRSVRPLDRAIAALADSQDGVVEVGQLRELGAGRGCVSHRVACGRLHPVHRGVFAVGRRSLTREGRYMAAVLTGGAGAALSHRAAAGHWGIVRGEPAVIEVSVPARKRSRDGVRFHEARLPPDEHTTYERIPITTPSRTLLDLAATHPPHVLERALDRAEELRLADAVPLTSLLERYPGRRGVARLRSVLDDRVGITITRSDLEERFLAFCAERGLPTPATNVPVAAGGRTFEVDCVWRAAGVIAELDGFAVHGTRRAFERDRERSRILQAAGWRVVAITWRHLHCDPDRLAADLRVLLAPLASIR